MNALFDSGFDILIIALGFGLLIFVHEAGHFLAAKWAGIRTEAFAIGMGPVVASWRKGVGLALGSTERKVVRRTGRRPGELTDEDLKRHQIGETEYSLRWVPIGGFVRMLGQDDTNPAAISSDPRSYGRCPIGRRMVVVSAGVIMNLLLAALFFIVAFMVGVPFPAPVIGDVVQGMPAAKTAALNAEALGISEPGLRPGDRVIAVDGDLIRTYADLQVAAAMSRPGVPLHVVVEREGLEEPLEFALVPEKDRGSGLLSIGVLAAASTTLFEDDRNGVVKRELEQRGIYKQGVRPGMTIVSAGGQPVSTFEQVREIVDRAGGEPVPTQWRGPEEGGAAIVHAELPVEPEYQMLRYADAGQESVQDYELGLLGLTPLVRVESIEGGENQDVLQRGDVVLRLGPIDGPRMAELREYIKAHPGQSVSMVVLRDGAEIEVDAQVSRAGLLGIPVGWAWEQPLIARSIERVLVEQEPDKDAVEQEPDTDVVEQEADKDAVEPDKNVVETTAVAPHELLARSLLAAVGEQAIDDWPSLRAALRAETAAAAAAGEGAEVELELIAPTPGSPRERIVLELDARDVADLHELGWGTPLSAALFESVEVELKADNPLMAVSMGLDRTWKTVLLTYLTIDRLFRGSVSVKQLRGPVGIVHLGTQIIDGGPMYLIFFLAMISVNLAVINFLPLPIVDGGLFLFLIYEKIKGHPPSIGFQNAATIVGLALIGTMLLVVTWNDVSRLIS